jgi:uncharacterized protein YjbI with pentapeptide repeats
MAMVRWGIRYQHSDRERNDVFPALRFAIAAGSVAGIALAITFAGVGLTRPEGLIPSIASGATVGAILGLFIGWTRAQWRLGSPLPAQQIAAVSLWDPWLDTGHDVVEQATDPIEVTPTDEDQSVAADDDWAVAADRVHIRPRVISPETGDAIRLDDEIGLIVQDGRHPLIGLIGGPGSGKTTALQHLTETLPPWALARVRMFDELGDCSDVLALEDSGCKHVITTGNQLRHDPHRLNYQLAPWTQDEVIEYLLAAHPDRCASVMARLNDSRDNKFIDGIPELWTIVLDRMARDELVSDVRSALRSELAAQFGDHPHARLYVQDYCLSALKQNANLVLNLSHSLLSGNPSSHAQIATNLCRLVRHRPVALLLAASRVTSIAQKGEAKLALTRQLPHDLIREAARQLNGVTIAVQNLEEWIKQDNCAAIQPMAASLLFAMNRHWRPGAGCRPRLQGAYLNGADWAGLDLTRVDLQSATLERVNLSRANLTMVRADRACLRQAQLYEAKLDSWVALGADISGANLHSVSAKEASFMRANLRGARLTNGNLCNANLQGALIEGADFTRANLEGAILSGLNLARARFEGARFGGADLCGCNLEDMDLLVADFHNADLRKALLTGSRMPQVNFAGAKLRDAGMAGIDWPGANLRAADLAGAIFHLGSSRNGLVGSPIACEGSRTGFYSDDYDDRDVKPAEEIRKANLRGADLRGANIAHVDFYLVDLRDAKYTVQQAVHLRRSGAILADSHV